jgi:aldehyde dehydrogenase (NAD+)
MCDLIKEAGFPAGVVNTVPGLGATTGDAISRHLDVDKVAFTGSVVTGRRISIAAAESNLKKVTLELGGKSPMVVFPSADIKEAASWTALGIWFNSGQDCCASSRVLVHESIYDEFVNELKTYAETAAIGSPAEEATSFGPLISAGQRDKVVAYIESGRSEGARVVTGGKAWPKSNGGYFVEPTILADTNPKMKVVREEIFGPVIVAQKFSTEEEAIELANDTTYGLAAGVFTNDARQMTRVSHELNAGTVWCNQAALLHVQVPFGGFKESGVGRELGVYGLEGYCQVKAVHQNLTQTVEWPL